MSNNGHFDGNAPQVNIFVFAYHKRGLLKSHPEMQRLFPEELNQAVHFNPDVATTLSIILRKSPPMNSIGDLLLNIIPLPKDVDLKEERLPISTLLYLLKAKTQVIIQKIAYIKAYPPIESTEPGLLKKFEDLLAQSSSLESLLLSPPSPYSSLSSSLSSLFSSHRETMTIFTRAVRTLGTFDYSSAYLAGGSILILTLAEFISYIMLNGQKPTPSCHPKEPLIFLTFFLLSALLSPLLGYSLPATLTLGLSLYSLTSSLRYIPSPSFSSLFSSVSQTLTTHQSSFILLLLLISLRILEVCHDFYKRNAFSYYFLSKTLLDYLFLAIIGESMREIAKIGKGQLLWKDLRVSRGLRVIRGIGKKVGVVILEVGLFYLAAIGDTRFLKDWQGNVKGVLEIMEERGVRLAVGAEGAGVGLALLGGWFLVKQVKVTIKTASLFVINMALASFCIRYLETQPFWGREVVPCTVLAISIFGISTFKKFNPFLDYSPFVRTSVWFCFLIPLISIIGGQFGSYQIILTVLLILNRFYGEGKQITVGMAVQFAWIVRMTMFTNGTRFDFDGICLKCGTLFYNDYHFMSWLPVTIRAGQSIIIGFFTILILATGYSKSRSLASSELTESPSQDSSICSDSLDTSSPSPLALKKPSPCVVFSQERLKEIDLIFMVTSLTIIADLLGLYIRIDITHPGHSAGAVRALILPSFQWAITHSLFKMLFLLIN